MNVHKWMVLGVATATALSLTACSKKPNATQEQPRMVRQNAVGNANGMGTEMTTSYSVSKADKPFNTARYAFHKNAMTAPANQTYYFAFNKAKLRSDAFKALDVQANYLAAHPRATVRLEGNTDSRGSREYNVGLGWRRDQTIARYLEQRGVSSKQIKMVSYGKERPAVTIAELGRNALDMVWALNRRVNMVYLNKG